MHQTYRDLLEIKDKAAAAIKIKIVKFPAQLKDYDCQLSKFMESLDDTMFNDWIRDWEKGSTTSNFYDETWTIIKGYFWIHLIYKLKKKINDKRLKELKVQRECEEEKKRLKELKELKEKEERNERKRKQKELKEAELAKEEKQKRKDEENQNFENNIIKKIKENESNIAFCKKT